MEIYDVVKKLIGNIEPVGTTYIDEKRLKNLKEHIDLTANLLHDLQIIVQYKDRDEYSMSVIGQKAYDFLKNLGVNV